MVERRLCILVRLAPRTTHYDYTITKDKEQRKRYLDRHRKRENWNDYMSAGSLSRWILWGDSSLATNIKAYKKKYKLK